MSNQKITEYIVELRRRADGRSQEVHTATNTGLPSTTFDSFIVAQLAKAEAERRIANELEEMR